MALLVASSLVPARLECESIVDPLGIDVPHPRLSWIVESPATGQRQTAYRIAVSDSLEELKEGKADLWDSGKVESSETLGIPYAGKPLRSAERVFWRVQVWDKDGVASAPSAPATWTMHMIPGDWKPQWIGFPGKQPVMFTLRKEIAVAKPVRRALAFVSGLGQYEMRIDGKKVGDDWITPGWTQYQKSVLVDTYDVTRMLPKGRRVLTMLIGNGMYNMATDTRGSQQTNSLGEDKAMLYLRIEHTDGSVEVVQTDATWQIAPGPETYCGVFGGEDWDARLKPKNWLRAIVVPPPTGELHGITHANPPVRVIETRMATSTEPKPNTLVIDLGQNAPYVPQVKVQGEAGDSIRMWPAEQLKPDGTVDQQTMRAGKYATYTLAGKTQETWHPLFWYCGSRYWQIEAFDPQGKPVDPKSILLGFKGLMVHSTARPVGTFECSNELFNQIFSLIHWAMRSNLSTVISDCPHREKSGWLEEDQLVGPGLMYCFDLSAMFRKIIEDMHDAQQPNGMVPTMAPEYFIYQGGFRDSVEWGGSYLFLPKFMRDWYDDRGLIARHYDAMKRYVDYLGTRTKGDILSTGLGDWNGYGNDPRTPVGITDTAYYYLAVKTLAGFAKDLGKDEDAFAYELLSERVRSNFDSTYLDPATGRVGTGSQSAQATALDLGLIPDDLKSKAFDALLQDVKDHDYAVSCGEVGHPSLLRVLPANGRADIVAKIHLQTDRPGYGWQIKKGMTTLTEAWDASPISLNHLMLGHIMEWFFADLVGIDPDPFQPGFKSFIIRPRPVPQVDWAKATYDSIRGPIACSWKIENGKFSMDLDVPANCTARVFMPAGYGGTVRMVERKTGKAIAVAPEADGGFEVPSGRFRVLSGAQP
ncbi:MAG TPA: family 78 glycoside hydrolase catalytic domain [Fimbriimonadaceae bacterium]|nr:family 78 glycoside hydrolase catalytic domain [Fimbriimonadaceae bacterium]